MLRASLWLCIAAFPILALAQDGKGSESKPAGEGAEAARKKAPAFALQDLDGKRHTLEQYKDKIVVLEWTEPGCPYIVRHAKQETLNKIAKDYGSKNVVVLGVCTSNKTDTAAMKKFAEEQKLQYPVLMDLTGEVGRAYDAKTTPHLFIVNQGEIVYQGAIDDDPRGQKQEGVVNYVRKAIDELLAKKPISTGSTAPYG